MKNTLNKICLSLALCATFAGCNRPTELCKNEIVVDTDFVLQSGFYGGAVQWEPNDVDSMSEAQWDRLLKRVKFMQLGYIRCIIRPYTYCLGFKDGKPQYIWDEECVPVSGDTVAQRGRVIGLPKDRKFSDAEWHRLAKRQWNDLKRLLQFCQENQIDVMFGDWWFAGDKNFYYLATEDPVYARIITDCVKHLVVDKGFSCIKQYNMGNEVNINPPGYTWEKWSTGMRNLYAEMEKAGLSEKVILVGPDGGYWQGLWFNETHEQLKKEVKVLDYHWYIDNDWLLTNRVEDEMRIMRFFTSLTDPQKPIVFGEVGVRDGHNTHTDQHNGIAKYTYGVGMADIMIQGMRAGWSAVTAWDMDDAMHYHSTGDVKVWGFWNSVGASQGHPEAEQIRPWYYVWSLMSRNFPKGSEILYTNSFRNNGLNCVAVRTPQGDLSFAIVNNTGFEQSVTVKIPNVTNRLAVNKYVYFENDRPVDQDSFPVVKEKLEGVDFGSGVQIDFPGQGFVMLSTIDAGGKPEIKTDKTVIYDPLDGLQRIHSHSGNLGMNGFAKHYNVCIDGEQPAFNFSRFLNDYSTIHPSTSDEKAYIIYKLDGFTTFNIGVSGHLNIDGRFHVYGSSDLNTWNEIAVSHLKPELGIWDWYHTSLQPEQKLSGYNYLKIEMDPQGWFSNSRLRDVRVEKK